MGGSIMETAIGFIRVMPETHREIDNFVEKVLNEIEPRQHLDLLARLTAMDKMIEKLKDGIKEKVLDEASLTGEKSFIINGVRYEKKTKTTNYYHNCQLHEELKARLKKLEDVMKAIEAPIADTDTGEIIPPALKSYTDYIAVSLRKE